MNEIEECIKGYQMRYMDEKNETLNVVLHLPALESIIRLHRILSYQHRYEFKGYLRLHGSKLNMNDYLN